MKQIIELSREQVFEILDNSVDVDGQVGFLYGREFSYPTKQDIDEWYLLMDGGSQMDEEEVECYLWEKTLDNNKQQVEDLTTALQGWVSHLGTAYTQVTGKPYPYEVYSHFNDDILDGCWFVGLKYVAQSTEYYFEPSGFTDAGQYASSMPLENILYELARSMDIAQYLDMDFNYNPEEWWSPTMVSMKIVEA